MRTAAAFIALLLALIVLASCAAQPESDRPTVEINVTQQSTATAAPTIPPTATPEPEPTEAPASQSPNVALSGTGRASAGEDSVLLATDGNPETAWSSTRHPAQWIAVALDDLYLVDRIELVVAQAPAGPDNACPCGSTTAHACVRNSDDSPTSTLRMGRRSLLTVDPPRPLKEILIQTLDSPSWVAWREVRAFGSALFLSKVRTWHAAASSGWKKSWTSLAFTRCKLPMPGTGAAAVFVVEQQGRISIVHRMELPTANPLS